MFQGSADDPAISYSTAAVNNGYDEVTGRGGGFGQASPI